MQAAEHDGGGAETDRPRATRRLRLLVASAFVVGVSVVGVTAGSAGAEHATSHTDASAYVLSDVHCSPRGPEEPDRGP